MRIKTKKRIFTFLKVCYDMSNKSLLPDVLSTSEWVEIIEHGYEKIKDILIQYER